jgi:NAD(P)-dependent dehydrogenase (short-subunit alcohol dehydrogenase family)
MHLGLEARTCLITGASRGIGRAVAVRLAAAGARLVLCSRSADRVEDAARECRELGAEAIAVALDVTEPDAAERLLGAAREAFGGTDVLVNNAGSARWRPLEEVPDEDWQAAWELNVMAPMRLMRAALPAMRERGWGRVVNVSSTAGKRPSANMPEYSVAKAAMLSLSRLFADRYAGDGVLVNAVCPGPTTSPMWVAPGGLADQSRELAGLESREEALAVAGAKRPIGRLADPGEIADVIVFLCSERASYVSGAAWSVDGGTVPVII